MPPFRSCLNASTIRGTPVLRQIEVAARAGYEGIELWFADTDAHVARGGTLGEIRRALDDHGLKVPTVIYLGGWFECPDGDWSRVKANCRRRLDEAAVLGAPFVIAGPPGGRADVETGVGRYRELLACGRAAGSLPAFEFLGFVEQFCTVESALDVLDRVGDAAGTTVVDPFHVHRGGGSFEGLARLRADQIAVAHFNDAPALPPRERQQDGDRVWPGDGVLPLGRYLDLLAGTGYRGWLSLELFREDLWARDPMEVALIGYEKMRAVVERVRA